MKVAVADTGPLRYLVLIEAIDLLPRLFDRVVIPRSVALELSRPAAPPLVRQWLASNPAWLDHHAMPVPVTGELPQALGARQKAAISIAETIRPLTLLIDDRAAIQEARRRGLEATGTLGVLVRAAQLGWIDLGLAFARLKTTNFRYRPQLLDTLLAQHESKT